MSGPRITVRMYQGLLGDCFLLRLFDGDGEVDRSAPAAANILIDCGIIQGASQARQRMERVAASIRKDTNDHLDLLVVTHEHFDHLSGFSMARDVFLDDASIRIDNIWLAWTEKDGDADAERLRTMFDKTRMAIAAGMERMAASEHLARRSAHATAGGGPSGYGFDDFLGPLGMGATGRLTTRATLSLLKEKVALSARAFLEPGQAKRTPGTVGLRAFVLGPPRNFERLFNNLPRSRAGDRETYIAAREGQAAASHRNFTMGDDGDGLDGVPFSRRYQQVSDAALLAGDLAIPAPDAPSAQHNLWEIRATYLSPDSGDADAGRWRTIDDDWCGPVGALAIKLDSDTNNSSLVLAFETEPGGDILLFAADAQVGNWLSWHDQPYPKDAAEGDRVSANELLARTLLYKVGHHGSHNATLSKAGLEMMTHPRLVAMLPNVKAMAEAKKWPFPHPELHQRLIEKTGGRILTGDEPPNPTVLANDDDFAKQVRVGPGDPVLGPLWVEYDVR